jgi:hypothetical protein
MLTYKNWSGKTTSAETFWEIQSANIQNNNVPLWVIEFDPMYGEFYND